MRPLRTLVAAVVAACCLAATAVAAAPDRTDPTLHAVAADAKLARSLLVTRADVPATFRVVKGAPDDDDGTCSTYNPDMRQLVKTADVEGKTFEYSGSKGFYQATSQAMLMRSAADAAAYWKGMVASRKVGPCLREVFVREGTAEGLTFANLEVTPATFSTSGLDIVSWNVTARARASKGSAVQMLVEVAFARRGRAVASVLWTSVGQPLPKVQNAIGQALGRRIVLAPVTG